ncbi:hypothetical protein [Lachnotalea sp. AF33-28]|mgnify:CR=1 FL=1|jgi:hypothetical protein|uniref:hypothetical protein n=1 Tax=Lachnotalea sp. AF33-28 TaxID=2292046 RepID=UPI000E48A1D5|nr:hypothetical protein [Lachnotalea sp. AF33-28]RHP29834.1 hypothetical protein DWZ56_20230 [Lachnotalea sp. AF33-28]
MATALKKEEQATKVIIPCFISFVNVRENKNSNDKYSEDCFDAASSTENAPQTLRCKKIRRFFGTGLFRKMLQLIWRILNKQWKKGSIG